MKLTQLESSLLHGSLVSGSGFDVLEPRLDVRPALALGAQTHSGDELDGEAHHGVGGGDAVTDQGLATALGELGLKPVKVTVYLRSKTRRDRLCRVWGSTGAVKDGETVHEEGTLGSVHPLANVGTSDWVGA